MLDATSEATMGEAFTPVRCAQFQGESSSKEELVTQHIATRWSDAAEVAELLREAFNTHREVGVAEPWFVTAILGRLVRAGEGWKRAGSADDANRRRAWLGNLFRCAAEMDDHDPLGVEDSQPDYRPLDPMPLDRTAFVERERLVIREVDEFHSVVEKQKGLLAITADDTAVDAEWAALVRFDEDELVRDVHPSIHVTYHEPSGYVTVVESQAKRRVTLNRTTKTVTVSVAGRKLIRRRFDTLAEAQQAAALIRVRWEGKLADRVYRGAFLHTWEPLAAPKVAVANTSRYASKAEAMDAVRRIRDHFARLDKHSSFRRTGRKAA